MSLFSLPVTSADIVALQQGILFTTTNAADINNQVSSINAPGTTETVASYANQLLASVQATSQMAMGVSALETGANQTVAVLTNLVTNPGVIPAYLSFAASRGLDAGQVVGESLGLAFSGAPGFAALAGLSTGAFAAAVSGTFGINQSFLVSQVQFFVNLYTGISPFPGNPNPTAAQIQSAANGAVFGLAVALNIEGVSTPPSIAVTTQTQVKNALFDIAQSGESPPGQKYVPGLTLPSHPVPTPFQSGPTVTGVFLTPGVDTPTSGFAKDANGTPLVPPGFTATTANSVFQALPFVGAAAFGNNTLNIGDDLETTGAATGATKLVDIISTNTFAANPPFATSVTINGVNQVDITNAAGALPGGFQGKVTGLLIENNLNSVAPVTLGGTGQGLATLLTDIKISGYGGVAGDDLNTVILAGPGDATKTINVSFTGGNLGTTKDGGAQEIAISNDLGGGTKAAPNLTYGTWALTINNNANLQLEQNVTTDGTGAVTAEGNVGGVGGATTLSLAGKGNIALSQDQIGEWRLLKTGNAGAESGTVIITGATAGVLFNAKGTGPVGTNNPFWLFGGDFGFLDNTGTGDFALTEYDLGSGTNVLDVSTATAAQIGALKTVANATPSAINEIIVQNAVATTLSADTFKNIAGFNILGIGGPTVAQGAAGTINLALLPTSISIIEYFTPANGSVTINNQTKALTVNVNDETTIAQNLTVGKVGAAPGLNDSLTVGVGNANHAGIAVLNNGGDRLGDITAFGDEVFTLNSVGGGAVAAGLANGANDIGGIILMPTLGGNEVVTISGNTTLQEAVTHSTFGAIQDQTTTGQLNINNLTVTDTNTAATEWGQASAGLLVFATDAGANGGVHAPVLNYSNNAVTIDASTSGGLIDPWGDANFIPGATVAASQGDTFIAATNPIGYQTGAVPAGNLVLGNVIAGSIGNDIFKDGNTGGLPDYYVTQGGKDTINLAAGHTGADHVGFYAAAGNVNAVVAGAPAYAVGSDPTAISESVAGPLGPIPAGQTGEFVNPGWWGIAAGGSSQNINVLFTNGHGTTAATGDFSTLTNWNPATDFLDFSATAWGTGLDVTGLSAQTAGSFLSNVGAFGGLSSPTGVAVNAVEVAPGGTIAPPAGAGPTDFIVLSQGSFLDGNAVAGALISSYQLVHNVVQQSPAVAGVDSDLLLAYQGLDGFAHIADLHLQSNAGGTSNSTAPVAGFTADNNVNVSDIVTLVGVNIPQLVAGISHVHLVA